MVSLSNEIFSELVEAARLAPSADNTQPCVYDYRADTLRVFLARSRLLPTDVRNMFSWMAAGAAVENIVLAASKRELRTIIRLPTPAPIAANGDLVAAELTFMPQGIPDPLAAWLEHRMTNRKPYVSTPLPVAALRKLADAAGEEVHVDWIRSESERNQFAEVMAECDRTRWEHRPFHEELFSILRLSREEAEATRDGLNLPSLEVDESQGSALRAMADFDVCDEENRNGFSKRMGRVGADLTKNAGAVGLVSIGEAVPQSWFAVGRAFERLWIAAASQQLSLQPIGGLPQFLTRLELAPDTFLDTHRERMQRVRQALAKLFPSTVNRMPGVLFRVGECAEAPLGRSLRLPAERLVRATDGGQL